MALAMKNLLTDVPGLKVGNAEDTRIASGATAVVFDEPAAAGFAVPGGAPALRDTGLLAPEMTVARVDAFVLSGGSVFGLDAPGGAIAWLHAQGRGLHGRRGASADRPRRGAVRPRQRRRQGWGRRPPYFDLGWAAAEHAGLDFKLGSVGAGCGATTCELKGGLGSASAVTSNGFVVGALAAVNAAGRATRGASPRFWAAAYERGGEFGGLGEGAPSRRRARLRAEARRAGQHHARRRRHRRAARQGAGDARRDHGDRRLRAGAAAGVRARPTATSCSPPRPRAPSRTPDLRDLAEIGMLAAECLARAIARGVYEATPLPFDGAMPSWKGKWGK